jgi:hypothetical protein
MLGDTYRQPYAPSPIPPGERVEHPDSIPPHVKDDKNGEGKLPGWKGNVLDPNAEDDDGWIQM